MFICLFIDCFIDWLHKKPASLFLTFKHMGKNQCWKKSEQFLQVVQCISDRVSICRTHPCIQLPELGSLYFHVMKMTTEMKITSHPCITLKNWWSTFIHTSSLHHANPVRRKAEAPWFVQSDTECPLWFSGGIPASRPVFLPICHSYSLFRSEESFVTTKLSILVSFHFKVLMMQLIRFFIFSDMWCFQAKKILIQPFGHLFDVRSLLALLGVCAHWPVTAGEGLGVRILFPANS